MALHWDWTDKMGECVFENGDTCNVYQGNACMIAVREFKETDSYSLAWFAADKVHLRNMLGLTKGYTNVIADWGISTLRLNTQYKSVPAIVSDFAKARMPITLELYE